MLFFSSWLQMNTRITNFSFRTITHHRTRCVFGLGLSLAIGHLGVLVVLPGHLLFFSLLFSSSFKAIGH